MDTVLTPRQNCWLFGSCFFFAEAIGPPSLYIFGDSSVVINWANNKETMSCLDLGHWCDNIIRLKESFLSSDCQHVYKEHNMRADVLSKEALKLTTGHLSFMKFYEDGCIGGGNFQLF